MKKQLQIPNELIQELIDSLAPSEETDLLRSQLNKLKEHLKDNNPLLYEQVFGKRMNG